MSLKIVVCSGHCHSTARAERIAIRGATAPAKTTLFRLINGELTRSGDVAYRGWPFSTSMSACSIRPHHLDICAA